MTAAFSLPPIHTACKDDIDGTVEMIQPSRCDQRPSEAFSAYLCTLTVDSTTHKQGAQPNLLRHLPSLPVDIDCVFLAYSVRPGHGLKVVLGVPVAVKDNHSVGGGQVDAQPPRPG